MLQLQLHLVLVAWPVVLIKNTKWAGQMTICTGVIKNANQYLRLVNVLFIMYPQVVDTVPVVQVNHAWCKSIQFDPLVSSGAENKRLTLFQEKCFLRQS